MCNECTSDSIHPSTEYKVIWTGKVGRGKGIDGERKREGEREREERRLRGEREEERGRSRLGDPS